MACFSAEQTVSLRALQSSPLSHEANDLRYFYLFLCPLQGLENQEVGLLSESWRTLITGLPTKPTKPHLVVGRVPAGAAGSGDVPGGGFLLAQLPAGVKKSSGHLHGLL